MKKTKYFLIATLVIFTFAGMAVCSQTDDAMEQPACDKYILPACPRNYAPLCGTDGNTYSNECVLCMEIKQRKANIRIRKPGRC
ncbi:trypsin inhibitor ClTI-1-like [Mobula birostris]|uniref:trypsin inhibitor ClTI-1-like n=1 Tax=Mobula birostris TaxID=1983395 RepID=UPI003B285F0B